MSSIQSIPPFNNNTFCDTKVRVLCGEAEQEISHLYDIFGIIVPRKIEVSLTDTTKSINKQQSSNMSSKTTTPPPPPPQTAEFGWGSQQEANKTTTPPPPPPPPQTADFGWGSQQEANKNKKVKKVKKTKKVKKVKEAKKTYHFDDLVKSNIFSFISQPPLVKIVSHRFTENRCGSVYRDVSRHVDVRKTKKALGMKGAGKIKVLVYNVSEDFDERDQTQIVYKYNVMNTLGMDTRHPQGKAFVIYN